MVVVKVPSINFCYVTNRTEFAPNSGSKIMAQHNFNFRSNRIGIKLSGTSKLAPFSPWRSNLLSHPSYSLWKGNRVDNLAVSNSSWMNAWYQLPQTDKAAKITLILYIWVLETFGVAFLSYYLTTKGIMPFLPHQERVDAFSIDKWLGISEKLFPAVNLVFGVFSAIGVYVGTIRLTSICVVVWIGEIYAYAQRCRFIEQILQLFQTEEGAEEEHTEIPLKILLKEVHDGWLVTVRKIPVHIDDLNKVPKILDDIELLMKSDDNFLAKVPPYCHISKLKNSYAELTFGCYMKQMDNDKVHGELLERLKKYAKVIRKHSGAIVL